MSKGFITRVFIADSLDISKNDRTPTSLPDLAHPINRTLGGARDRLVPFLQKRVENRKVLDWVLEGSRVGLNIDNVGGRMFGKISLEDTPGAGQDPAPSIKTRDRPTEDITRERECCDVTRGRTLMGIKIDF